MNYQFFSTEWHLKQLCIFEKKSGVPDYAPAILAGSSFVFFLVPLESSN